MNNGIEKNINATQSVNMRTAPKMEWLRVTPQAGHYPKMIVLNKTAI